MCRIAIFLLLVTIAGSLICGCATPVIAGHDRFGLGFFTVRDRPLHEHAHLRSVEGVGFFTAGGRTSFGYIEHHQVEARPDDEGFAVQTPIGLLATGRTADRLAAGDPELRRIITGARNE